GRLAARGQGGGRGGGGPQSSCFLRGGGREKKTPPPRGGGGGGGGFEGCAPIAQLDRALASGAKGRRFDSCWAHQFSRGGRGGSRTRGPLAQLVEQLTLNQRVQGSSP